MTVGTTLGTALAYLMVPMRSLGPDGWKVAAALMGRHIGGGLLNRLLYIAQSSSLYEPICADNI